MNSVIAQRPDFSALEHARFKDLPSFPLECETWDGFVEAMQSDETHLFAFRLMRQPRMQETFLVRGGVQFDPLFFGHLTRRTDGRIGRLCFGEFEGVPASKGSVLKVLDGFGKEEIEPMFESTEEMLSRISQPHGGISKISKLYLDAEEVQYELIRWLERRVGDKGEDGGDLSDERALDLKMLRFVMRQVIPDRSMVFPGVADMLERLDQKLAAYLNSLQEQLKAKRGEVEALEAEIASFE